MGARASALRTWDWIARGWRWGCGKWGCASAAGCSREPVSANCDSPALAGIGGSCGFGRLTEFDLHFQHSKPGLGEALELRARASIHVGL